MTDTTPRAAVVVLLAGVPPRSETGPMIIAGKFNDWWIYLLAAMVGGTLGAFAGAQLTGDRDQTQGR
jgi:hypothetical protein